MNKDLIKKCCLHGVKIIAAIIIAPFIFKDEKPRIEDPVLVVDTGVSTAIELGGTEAYIQHILNQGNTDQNNTDQNIEKLDGDHMVTKYDILGENSGEQLENTLLLYPAGTIVNIAEVQEDMVNRMFYSLAFTEDIKERIYGISYAANCGVPYEDLRYIRVLYFGFDSQTHIGEMIVNQQIESDMVEIFRELYQNKYPIEKMVLIDDYNGDDDASMAANNSSSFNYRNIDRSNQLSLHSYGMAVDINPLYNPYVRKIDGQMVILPEEGKNHVERSVDNSYYIKSGDICYEAFTCRGFTWGGDWINSKDYQHFQKAKR